MTSTAPRKSRITKARRERMAKALKLREAGANVRDIGAQLGVSHTQAANDIRDALREIIREPAEDVLQLELARLDNLFLIAFQKARKDQDTKAIDSAVRIMDRRAKYLGLDNPNTQDDTRAVSTLLERLIEGAPDQ